jgi:excisionase family DNA binding protein
VSEPSPWLTIDQAAARLHVHVRTVERMVAAKKLTEYRGSNRTRRYRVADVDAVMVPVEPEPQD